MARVDKVIRADSPLELLEFASAIVESSTPAEFPFEQRSGPPPVPLEELVPAFIESGQPPMAILARALLVLSPNPSLEARLTNLGPIPGAPSWLDGLGSVTVEGAGRNGHILDDGENVMVGFSWPHGSPSSLVAYVDHNMGTLIKDAFFVPDDLRSLMALQSSMGSEEGIITEPLALAEARARLAEALEVFDMTIGTPEGDTWPAMRPLVRWLLGRLPEGGVGYVRPEWSEAELDELTESFLSSPHARIGGLRRSEVDQLVDPLLWFGSSTGTGDPLRWSPVSVEIVLADWYRRKVFGLPEALLRRLPEVLAGLVRFAHERRGIPADLTVQTLDAVEEWAPLFRSGETQPGFADEFGPDVDLGEDFFDFDDASGFAVDPDDEDGLQQTVMILEATLTELAGGPERFADLDDAPLPDLAFDWSMVPEELRSRTEPVVADMDRWAVELFDAEVRSIARVVLAHVIAEDPATVKRGSKPASLAAAVLAMVMKKVTERVSAAGAKKWGWRVATMKALAEATGVSVGSISSRSKTIANTAEWADIDWPSILHSCQRAELLEAKASIEAWHNRSDDDG